MTATQPNVSSIAPPQPKTGWTPLGAIAIVFISAIACFLPLPVNSPLAGTEGHRAITAHQMVESGEWLVPRMYGRVYLAKPPLHYWIQATFETVSGHAAPFIWRLPSAIEGAMLAALLCWLGARWFGGVAGIVSGFAYVALICMWGQDRGADIDITNALVSTLAAICLLEMQFGLAAGGEGSLGERSGSSEYLRPGFGGGGPSLVMFTLLAGLAIGASFLTKGPCGLPPILGAMIWIAIVRIREKHAIQLLRPRFWLPLLIGVSIFAIYAYATSHYIHSHHMAADLTGVQEGTEDLHPHDWSLGRAIGILILPLVMFVYALPVSIALPMSFLPEIRAAQDATARSRMMALSWTILLSWAACFVSGMHLPRYAYVTLPLLCPIAGAVAVAMPRLGESLRWVILGIAAITTVVFGLVVVALAVVLWRHSGLRPMLMTTSVIALALVGIAIRALKPASPNWRGLYVVPLILICLAANAGYVTHYDRLHRSSLDQGKMIASITGPDAHLSTCAMVLDQPELFYYSGLPTHAFDGDTLDWRIIPLNSWVVLEPQELAIWQHDVPDRLKYIYNFVANKNPGELVWYSDVPPATRQ
jgi:4-amino-4-deoxy-L-arabinose transferase-like glycosyltransferase